MRFPRGARGVANATAIRLAGAAKRLARAEGGRVERVHTVLVSGAYGVEHRYTKVACSLSATKACPTPSEIRSAR